MYVDHILIFTDDPVACALARDFVLQTVRDAGLCVNYEKSEFEPSQLIHFLGVCINFATGRLKIPPAKRKDYRREIGKLVTKSDMSLRGRHACLERYVAS